MCTLNGPVVLWNLRRTQFFFFRLLSSSVVRAPFVEHVGVCCVRVCDLKYFCVVVECFLGFR